MVGIVKTPPRVVAFKKGDMEGRVLRTKLMDKTGRITLVAWNDKAAELEGLKKGSMIQVGNARLKTGLDGQPEIHADVRSRISILPPTAESLQVMTEALTKISQITSNRKDLDILVTALKVDPATEVARNTGEKTKVAGLLLADDTGIIRASFWDDKAELSAGLKEGDNILIEEATSREWRGEISLTVGRSSYVTVNPEGRLTETKIALTSLRDLTETSPAVAVEGIVSDQPLHRQIQTSKGETVDMTEFGLKDTSAERRVVLWRKLAQEAAKLGSGARVRITGALPRRGLTGDLELSSGPITYLDVLQTSESASTEAVAKVVELKDGSRGAVQGLIIEISNKSSASMICKNCGGKIEFENTETVCDKCGPIKDMELSATLILTIDDGTGFIEAVFPSPHSNILLDDEKEWIRRRILEQRVPRLPLSLETLSRLIGRRILVEGNVHRDSQTKSLVLHSEKVSDLHPSVRNNA
jgi:replication factor A1